MKYFIDFEFIEGFNKPLLWPFLGKKRHFIDLISVGIVCEDGREYYAISKDFNPKDADRWVKENVIEKLPERHFDQSDSPRIKRDAMLWKHNNMIVFEIKEFFQCVQNNGIWNEPHKWTAPKGIEVYGYYADYDWVLLCSLFGRMIDLPEGFPMYCKDLKQMLDEYASQLDQLKASFIIVDEVKNPHLEITSKIPEKIIDIKDWTFEQKLEMIKAHKDYPKQSNEHNALSDAKWNKELYKFIQPLL